MAEFYNPYNFVPLKTKINGEDRRDLDYRDIENGHTQVRHDLWRSDLLSGELEVHLTTKTPTFVGNQHIEQPHKGNRPKTIQPYEYKGVLAFPASSLRGMISSVCETISQSNMRVLGNPLYSARAKPNFDALSAIGQVVVEEKNGNRKYFIRALKLPTVTRQRESKAFEIKQGDKWLKAFGENSTWDQSLGYYVNGLTRTTVIDPKTGQKQSKTGIDDFLSSDHTQSFNPDKPVFYSINRAPSSTMLTTQISGKRYKCKGNFLIAAGVASKNGAKSDGIIINRITDASPHQQTTLKGIIYYLDTEPDSNFTLDKKHQWFIPYDEKEIEARPLLEIPDSVLADWYSMSKLRNSESKGQYPLVPKVEWPTNREQEFKPESNNDVEYLKNGELIYFDIDDPEDKSQQPKIRALSYSAIWRIPMGYQHAYFNKHGPWESNDQLSARASISPAEALFGAVEKTNESKPSRSFASRLSFTDATFISEHGLTAPLRRNDATLKILASPKAPSPSMYFKSADGGYISKQEMSAQKVKAIPNGWKRYLPASKSWSDSDWQDNESKNDKLKVRAAPIDSNQTFKFKIKFDNLTQDELSLLTKSIEPSPSFHHRLGLGKSLGLGMVQLKISHLNLIDRQKRYSPSELTNNSKFDQSFTGKQALEAFQSDTLIDQETFKILNKIGIPDTLDENVKTEHIGHQWFVKNEKRQTNNIQTLSKVDDSDSNLPTLHKI